MSGEWRCKACGNNDVTIVLMKDLTVMSIGAVARKYKVSRSLISGMKNGRLRKRLVAEFNHQAKVA